MISIKARGRAYDIGKRFVVFSGLLSTMLGIVKSANTIAGPEILKLIVLDIKEYAIYIFFVSLLLSFLGWILAEIAGNKSSLENTQYVLDQLQKEIFPRTNGRHLHQNRVTLFRWKGFCFRIRHHGQWCLPWDGWLVPYLRSGHNSKASKSCFKAKKADGEFEGVAGLCLSTSSNIVLSKLQPPLKDDEISIKSYCKITYSDIGYVKQRLALGQELALSYLAIFIEVKGEPWGCIVVDSIEGTAISDDHKDKYKVLVGLLSKILEKLS